MSTIKTETLSTPSNATVPVDTVVNGTAKAWVNFNGTDVVAIRRAFNVSSITDNGNGDYTVNFTTAMTDANYSVSGACEPSSSRTCILMINNLTNPTASDLRIFSAYSDASLNRVAYNSAFINVSIFS